MRLSLARIAPAACLLLVTVLPAGAATITGDFLFTENRGPNPVFSSGWKLVIGATNVNPAGPRRRSPPPTSHWAAGRISSSASRLAGCSPISTRWSSPTPGRQDNGI